MWSSRLLMNISMTYAQLIYTLFCPSVFKRQKLYILKISYQFFKVLNILSFSHLCYANWISALLLTLTIIILCLDFYGCCHPCFIYIFNIVRIEFEDVELSGPSNGECKNDTLQIIDVDYPNLMRKPVCGSLTDNDPSKILDDRCCYTC